MAVYPGRRPRRPCPGLISAAPAGAPDGLFPTPATTSRVPFPRLSKKEHPADDTRTISELNLPLLHQRACAAVERVRFGQRHALDIAVGLGPFAWFSVTHIPILARWICAHDREIRTRLDPLMAHSRGKDNRVALLNCLKEERTNETSRSLQIRPALASD